MYIDAHCHLTDPRLKPYLDKYINEAIRQHISGFVMAGYDPNDWDRQRELQKSVAKIQVFPVFGIHPWVVIEKTEKDLEAYWKRLNEQLDGVIAIGETGLDFFRDKDRSRQKIQMMYLRRHIDLAVHTGMPLVLHSVRAHQELITELGKYKGLSGIVHGFRGSEDNARKYQELGFHLSFPSSILARDQRLSALYSKIGTGAILETDAPNLVDPDQENPLLALISAAEAVAGVLGKSCDEVLKESTRNVKKVFGLSDV